MGQAFVTVDEYSIKAGYIKFNLDEHEAYAESIKGKNGEEIGRPTFSDGTQEFQYNKLRFNFKTNKGLVYDARIEQGGMYVHGAVTKFVPKNPDSLILDDAIYNRNALITTCDLDHPHWGIRTTKLKLIPDKLAVIGPARLELAGVPTPLFIPFAFAPLFGIAQGHSGIVFGGQQGFEVSPRLGIGFREIGYYFALSDYYDLKVTGDIYTRGTWGLQLQSNYAKRYKFRGTVGIGYSSQIVEREGDLTPGRDKSFRFTLNHNQDTKFHPYISLGGNLNFTTNDYDRRNFNDSQSQLENVINSSFRFSHNLPNLDAWTMSATIGHQQNTRNRSISFTLPDVQLRMKTVYPFKKKNSPDKEKWFEKINMQYTGKMKNYVSTFDTILFTKQTLEKLQSGISHDLTTSASFNIAKYISFNPRVSYDELWFFKTLDQSYDPDSVRIDPFTLDTLQQGAVVETFNTGFNTYRDLEAGFDLTTSLFKTLQFKRGWLRGLRHVAKPRIGMSFRPSTERYYEVVEVDDIPEEDWDQYNPFSGGIFGTPRLQGKQAAITYGINNTFEGKYYSKRDTTEKKFKILNNINLNGSYNFAADSLRWSEVRLSGNGNFFKNITSVRIAAVFDPYLEKNNRRIDETVWGERKRFLRFESFSTTITSRTTIGEIVGLFSAKDEAGETRRTSARPRNSRRQNTEAEKAIRPSLLSMLENFRISHTIDLSLRQRDGVNEFDMRAHSIRMSGGFELTANWGVQIGNFSYDFKNSTFVYPDLSLTRDLHCWEMGFSWQPARGTYRFNINVKSPQFSQYLKYNYGKNQFDRIF